jgi:CheY-like chemotaxis protein
VGVVDDEPQVRIFLRMLLEDAGHKVTCYRTGEEALAGLLAMDPPPEVVLADLIMPGMSGLELWQELRHKYPDLPFVLCSGHVEAALSPEVRAADVAAFVKKPIDPEALLALLARVTATNRKEVHS